MVDCSSRIYLVHGLSPLWVVLKENLMHHECMSVPVSGEFFSQCCQKVVRVHAAKAGHNTSNAKRRLWEEALLELGVTQNEEQLYATQQRMHTHRLWQAATNLFYHSLCS
jgi:hypothetical protein